MSSLFFTRYHGTQTDDGEVGSSKDSLGIEKDD